MQCGGRLLLAIVSMATAAIHPMQVKIGLSGASVGFQLNVTFDNTDWFQWKDVYVLPVTNDGVDGQDFKCFAVQPSLVQYIQGMRSPVCIWKTKCCACMA